MARYRMEDGTVVNTDKAAQSWDEAARWDGRNYISVATGDQWTHETLYKSAKGRYYIEHDSQWQGSTPSASYVDAASAAKWLLLNEHALPEDLTPLAMEVEE